MGQTKRLRALILVCAAALLILQWVTTAWVVTRAHETAMENATDTVRRIGRAVETSINRNFVQVDAMLAGLPSILAPTLGAGIADPNAVGRVLRELNNQNFTFRDVILLREDGRVFTTALASSRRRPLPAAWPEGFVQTTGGSGGLMIGGPARNPQTQEWSVFLARRVTLPGIGPVVAVAEMPISVLGTILSVGGEGGGLRVTLEREDGLLFAAHPHDEPRMGQRLAPPASRMRNSDQVEVVTNRSRFSGEPVLISVRPTIYSAVLVTASLRHDDALAAWMRDRERTVIASTILSALVIAVIAALLLWLRQRERAEAERAQARAMLDNAIESMSDGFVMFDAADRLVTSNSRYREIYALSAPFIISGARFEDILREGAKRGQYPQAGPDLDTFVTETTRWHRGDNPPMERLLPDGRWVLITERRTPDGGTVGIRTDITALKLAMEELAAARDAAAEAAEAKSAFLARMSHELRTPLNAILGFAQILLRDETIEGERREQLDTLHGAAGHLLALVNGLLDLSKIEAGRLELELRPIVLTDLLNSCADLLGPEAARKSLALRRGFEESLPREVMADPTRLRQLVLNLLSNAVKFTPPGGLVALRARLTEPAGLVRIEVQDTGPGLSAEQRARLFEDFVQVTPTLEPGTGLGLAISARLAALMGGRISCDSEPGQGALFWVELPLAASSGVAVEAAAPALLPAIAARVLVVDDVLANRLVAKAMLAPAGHEVRLASDGQEALGLAAAEPFDVILMDVQMPGMDGLEATRRIRALPGRSGRVPIVAVTASAMPEQVAACTAAGMDRHLAKPIDRAALLGLVAELAHQARHAPPVFDPAAPERLMREMGRLAGTVAAGFIAEIRLARDALRAGQAFLDGPAPSRAAELTQVAHRLQGGARMLGAERLAHAAEALERSLRQGQPAATAFAETLAAAEASLPLLDAWLAEANALPQRVDALP
jgi:signal transduction histidine kinase/DNA-binding response OmpR family regulator